MRATITRSPTRKGKRRLLESCAIGAGMIALANGGPALAQVAANPIFVNVGAGTSVNSNGGTKTTTVNVTQTQSIINWVPTDTATTGGDIDVLPADSFWNFNGNGNYIVLNRFVNGAGGSLSRQIALNGTINSTNSAASGARGGSIWFYNAGGILVGDTGAINVGSLVLTTNDIVTTGGLLDPTTGAIRFRGASGSTAGVTVNGAINANEVLNPGSSYIALVAPRVNQNGFVDVYGSAAYVAAEQADIRINAGLFDINVLTGAAGGQAITHTGITTGPEEQAAGSAQRIYMVAIPKNDAVTMLVSGQVGYQDTVTTAQTDSAGRIILSAGYNVTNGTMNVAPVNATASDITVADIIFRSDVTAHASGAFLGQPFQSLPTGGPTTFVPPPHFGRFVVQGNGVFTGETSATLNIGANRAGTITGALVVRANGTAAAPGTAAINVDGGGLAVQGITLVSAAAFYDTPTGDSQGGNASLNVTGSGQALLSGGLDISADGFGGLDGSGKATGDGRGGSASISVSGPGSALSGGNIQVHANGFAASPSSGLDIADTGGAGIGGNATISVQNGGSLSTTAGLAAEANGFGGFGLIQSGGGTGGSALIEASGSGTTLQAASTAILATGIGGGDFAFDPVASALLPTLNGGDGRGGSATLRISADSFSTVSLGDASLDASASGGSAGDFSTPSGENSTGGDAVGGTATVEHSGGGLAQLSSLDVNVSALSGSAYSASGTTGRSGDAQGGTIAVSVTGAQSNLALSGGAIVLDASGGASTSGRENVGSGTGGAINVSVTGGGAISEASALFANAFGGSAALAPLISAGSGAGGSIDLLADSGGIISADTYQLSARGRVVNTTGNNGAAQGGDVTMIARSGGAITTLDGVSSIDAGAVDGISADGSSATGGTIQMIADAGTISLASTALDASALSGGNDTGSASLATGGSISIRVGADPASQIAFESLDATANGSAGALYDGFIDASGDATGGTVTVDVQGGSLSTLSLSTGFNLAADGNGGAGGTGRGGSVAFTQTGGDISVADVSISADGMGDPSSDGFGGSASLTLGGGTFTGGIVSVHANGLGGDGRDGDDSNPGAVIDAGNGGYGQGGTAAITITGDAAVNATALNAYATGTGGRGGDFFNYDNAPRGSGNGGAGRGGNATVNLVAGDLTADAVLVDAGGIGGDGGNQQSSSSTGSAIGMGVGGAGGDSFGGAATLALGGTTLTLSEGLLGQSGAVGGNGGYGSRGGGGGQSIGGLAQAIVDNYDAGALPVSLDSSASGGNGGTGGDGDGGSGGAAIGGISRIAATGSSATVIVSQANFQTGATGGAGGSAFTDFSSTPTVGGHGGDGGSATGGTIEIAANDGGTINLGFGSSGGLDLSSGGFGGNGGSGANNPNTITLPGPDGILGTGDDVTQGLTGGDGGTGGSGVGGTVALLANGGTITSGGGPLTITVGGTSGASGLGGTGSGGSGNCCSIVSDQGGRVIFQTTTTPGGAGLISLGDTVARASGGIAGRIEVRSGGSISMTSLDAEAFGTASPTNNDTNLASTGIFLAATDGTIATTGDMALRTDGSVGAYAQGSGGVNVGGGLTIEAADQVDLRHDTRAGAVNPSLLAGGDMSISAGTSITGAPGTLLSAGGTLALNTTAATGSIAVDRLAGNDIIVTTDGQASVEHADAVNDFIATVGSFRTGLNSIITGGDIMINAVGTVDLGNSTAGGLVSVNGQSIAYNSIDAGSFVSLFAQGTGATDGIFGTDISAGNSVSLYGGRIAVGGTVQAGGGFYATAIDGDAAIGLANAAGDISLFAAGNLSGTYRAGGNVSLTADGNVTGEADAAGGYVDPSGGFTSEGYVLVEAGGNASLTNSSAATMIGLRAGGAASLTGGAAGEDVFVLAGTTATLSNISAGDDLTVQAGGSISVTDAATTGAGPDSRSVIYASGSASPISFLQISSTPADLSNVTLTAGADIAAANVSAFDNLSATAGGAVTATGPLAAGNDLFVSAADAIALTSAASGGNMNLSASNGIAAGNVDSGGATTLASSDGAIAIGSLLSVGGVDASGNSIAVDDGGDLTFVNLVADVGDANVRTSGALLVSSGSVAGRATLRGDGSGVDVASLTAASVSIQAAGGSLSLGDISATASLDASALSSLLVSGTVTGQQISLASADIAIGSAGRIGTAGQTQTLSVVNNRAGQQTFIGGTGTRSGYHIDADEMTRLFGTDIQLVAPAAGLSSGAVASAAPGGIAPDRTAAIGGSVAPDVVVDSFTMMGGASGSNLGANGALTIRTAGKMRVVGNVRLTGLADTNALNLRADRALEVILGQGTVGLRDANGAPGGRLNMQSADIIVATPAAIGDVANATTLDAIEKRLAQNDGITLDEGSLVARGIGFAGNVYVQNSGTGTDYAQRRGLTFGAGGLDVQATGPARIVLNGVQLGANGQVTGLDAIPLLTIAGGPANASTNGFDRRSTFNGCLIINAAVCTVAGFDRGFPVQDVIEEETDQNGEGDKDDGVIAPSTALIMIRDIDPLSGEPLLDDPVTGAGNDDLWTPNTDQP